MAETVTIVVSGGKANVQGEGQLGGGNVATEGRNVYLRRNQGKGSHLTLSTDGTYVICLRGGKLKIK